MSADPDSKMLEFIRDIAGGAAVTGRWVTSRGDAIDGFTSPGIRPSVYEWPDATWEPYSIEENEAYLADIAARAQTIVDAVAEKLVRKTVTETLGFHVEEGTVVVMTAPCLGETHEGDEVETTAGAVGRVHAVTSNSHGLNVEIVIHAGQSKATGEDLHIVNIFSADDPAPRFPFVRADSVVPDALMARENLEAIRNAARAYDDDLNRRKIVPSADNYNYMFGIATSGAKRDPVRDAAPDMLAALKTARKVFRVEYADNGRVASVAYEGDALRPLVDILDDAISKAEGRANG